MYWGIDVSDGWYDIIDALCQAATYTYTTSIMIDEVDGKRLNIDPYSYTNITTYHFEIKPPQLVADQVKEKFGTLRVYHHLEYDPALLELEKTNKYPELKEIMNRYNAYFDGIVHMAETLSERTCEITGQQGELHVSGANRYGWYKTLNCDYAKNDAFHVEREYVPVSMLDLNKTVQMSPEPFIKKKHHE
jgi:hypothetical protein